MAINPFSHVFFCGEIKIEEKGGRLNTPPGIHTETVYSWLQDAPLLAVRGATDPSDHGHSEPLIFTHANVGS